MFIMIQSFYKELKKTFKGEIKDDEIYKKLYATDASAYREIPAMILIPKDKDDLITIVKAADKHKVNLIPRAAGTSLAGQVVGGGVVVYIGHNFSKILEINTREKWVRLQPGVVLDELNKELAKHNLFFGPETSTSNRCMIGGMLGNNSCGAHSLIYGSVRDHIIEVEAILADGSVVVFKDLDKDEFQEKLKIASLEGKIYRKINEILSNKEIVDEIKQQYPHPDIKRRNTGYALDILLDTCVFTDSINKFNLSKLIAGSEGTLALVTELKLNLVDIPPKHKALMCVHVNDLREVFYANLIALKHKPVSIELMDKKIMDLTKENINQNRNRFFVDGDPAAILIVEWFANDLAEIDNLAENLKNELLSTGIGYAYPVIKGKDISRVWELRKAGLGVLTNMQGDAKPVPVVEDTAVRPEDLPDYMEDFSALLKKLGLECVYYAHIGTGELHLRPVLNLKDPEHVQLFHTVAYETALLVKKYRGSLSGEHGDGRLRGEFIPLMYGQKLYEVFKQIKTVWDPKRILNPNKIVDTPPMNTSLRYQPGMRTPEFETYFDFSRTGGFLRTAEKCNGSGDCRKTAIIGGTLCPSFQATLDEKHSTRARANIIREIFTNYNLNYAFNSKEIKDVLDLCLLCKACKSECPSGVDVAKLKMEFLQHYYDYNSIPLRSLVIGYLPIFHQLMSPFSGIFNFFMKNKFSAGILKRIIGFNYYRNIPLLNYTNFSKILKSQIRTDKTEYKKKIYLFTDEFTRYLDSQIGIAAIKLFSSLGYDVKIAPIDISGRTFLSKGLLKKAQKVANKNIEILKDLIDENTPLVGIEPSAILTFRDEYPDLAYQENRVIAEKLSKNAMVFDEFICSEIEKGNIQSEYFTDEPRRIKFHGHCQQKALTGTNYTLKMLSLPRNYIVEEIPSGCCGMAGSFGYEKEHYDVSMKIGELVLFPAVRKAVDDDEIVVAAGTSCRCQIQDGTGAYALHPIELLFNALKQQ